MKVIEKSLAGIFQFMNLKKIFFVILLIIWYLVIFAVGQYLFSGFGFLNGFSTSSFSDFLLAFLKYKIIIGLVAVLPLLFFSYWRKILFLPAMLLLLLSLYPLNYLLWYLGPLPVPDSAINPRYSYRIVDAFGSETKFRFDWGFRGVESSVDEMYREMKKTASIYDDFAKRRGIHFVGRYSNVPPGNQSPSCEQALDYAFEVFNKSVEKTQARLKRGEYTAYWSSSIRAECALKNRLGIKTRVTFDSSYGFIIWLDGGLFR